MTSVGERDGLIGAAFVWLWRAALAFLAGYLLLKLDPWLALIVMGGAIGCALTLLVVGRALQPGNSRQSSASVPSSSDKNSQPEAKKTTKINTA